LADITTRRQGEMIQTLFRILEQEPEGLQAKEAIARVQNEMEPTEFEMQTFPNNPSRHRPVPEDRPVRDHQLSEGGLAAQEERDLDADRGGRPALHQIPDPEALYRESRRLYQAWKAAQPEPEAPTGSRATDSLESARRPRRRTSSSREGAVADGAWKGGTARSD
jgi:restriction system protein